MHEEKKTDNFIMRMYLETIQSIVGPNGLKSVLNYAHLEKYINNFPPGNDELGIPLKELQALFRSLYDLFGSKGVRGLQLRVGRESGRIFIEGRPEIAESLRSVTHILPETMKMRLVLEKMVEQNIRRFPSQSDAPLVELKEEKDCFLIIYRDRYESEGITAQIPVCNVFVGNVQYAIQWVTGGEHKVEEVQCRAMGHPVDIFKISKARKEG